MDDSLCEALSRACGNCQLGGGCCFEARPPLTQNRIDILLAKGVSPESIEFAGYKRLKLKRDGFCALFENGMCSVHSIKPETCVAGPFTFDMQGDILQIFLKKESIPFDALFTGVQAEDDQFACFGGMLAAMLNGHAME